MFISIDENAFSWFAKEFELNAPFSIRMYPQYAGFGEKHKGYSLAFSCETPTNPEFTQEIKGITFYVEGNDLWFFNDAETYLTLDPTEELHVSFIEQ
ncbi:HesB/YadR/YfhF family protein [Neobacillus sp. SM06]|uniref:HesB/YadR/YfhF family protein n=1 Tax=Neobacillus sp. SM06 TaxID=3422492 RepID=UPI003D276733